MRAYINYMKQKKGRYLKFSRTLSQTKWIISGERRLQSSIEEIMGDILKAELSAKGIFKAKFFLRRFILK